MNNKIFRLRSSVALIYKNGALECFLTNPREPMVIVIEFDEIVELLHHFNGLNTISDVSKIYPSLDSEELVDLVVFLNEKNVLIEVDHDYLDKDIEEKYRLINTMEDFYKSTSEVYQGLELLRRKTILIVGLGAVGTWIVASLARNGVKNFILIDDDKVDITNLHRQDCYFESDVGLDKIDAVENFITSISEDITVHKIKKKMFSDFFHEFDLEFDVAINCADYPSVDVTTEILAEYCMSKNIPHIVGGGYNLHLTLVGQTVVPNHSACVKCFKSFLDRLNSADLDGVRKLAREKRKIGSFGPLCAIAASLSAIEAFKLVLERYEYLINVNKRIEFITRARETRAIDVPRDPHCEWCGARGLYTKKDFL